MKWTDEASLRRLAETAIALGPAREKHAGTRDELLHELSVHHAELEMQNEALRDAQTELWASEARYRDLFESGPSGYLVVDERGVIELANGTAGEILSEPVEKVVGCPLASYLLPAEAIGFERYRREALRSSARLTADFKFRAAGGGYRDVCVASSRVNTSNGRLRVALSDVTAYKEMIRRDEHRIRLEALRRHASVFAQDLNGLLVSVLGHADVALQSLSPDDAAFQQIQQIRELGYRCALSTGQLAAVSRPDPVPAVPAPEELVGNGDKDREGGR